MIPVIALNHKRSFLRLKHSDHDFLPSNFTLQLNSHLQTGLNKAIEIFHKFLIDASELLVKHSNTFSMKGSLSEREATQESTSTVSGSVTFLTYFLHWGIFSTTIKAKRSVLSTFVWKTTCGVTLYSTFDIEVSNNGKLPFYIAFRNLNPWSLFEISSQDISQRILCIHAHDCVLLRVNSNTKWDAPTFCISYLKL